ncbi:MAG: hypothetical protein AVDCRST_MAG54-1726 [uncultured Actinomycetospora sp.]|uniref:HTH luxR-type domain-containing protein n=1 Tax=uncultured Actinomycetospora sp. TaxID=1135996 RepID=A0A6J4IAM8_9PSEU|nr:MAG: hypothetical protein AVDCRST_MAG54-1726 [uncultured Actinomycetospora sp.]
MHECPPPRRLGAARLRPRPRPGRHARRPRDRGGRAARGPGRAHRPRARGRGPRRRGPDLPEIGARLFLSAKTVEHHVARLRHRLGSASRSELFSDLRSALGR